MQIELSDTYHKAKMQYKRDFSDSRKNFIHSFTRTSATLVLIELDSLGSIPACVQASLISTAIIHIYKFLHFASRLQAAARSSSNNRELEEVR